jgi:GH24 family phage-related lysozyme (muramidase)
VNASKRCIDLIEFSEGFSEVPYQCPAGVWTIGFGSTRNFDGTAIKSTHPRITRIGATNLMLATLKTYEDAVNRYVTVPINQNQFDALIDFAYNAGAQNLRTSTLLKKLNAGDYLGASEEFKKWIYSGSKMLKGLMTRRRMERDLFNEVMP